MGWIISIAVLGIISNILYLSVPRLAALAIDQFQITGSASREITLFLIAISISFVLALAQIFIATYISKKIGFDVRNKLINKVSNQSYGYVSTSTPGRLLTVLTSDVDGVITIVSQTAITILGAVVVLLGSIVMLLTINIRLALYTLSVLPFLIIAFGAIFMSLGTLFQKAQETVEKISSVISETIVGASLVRVLSSFKNEMDKFYVAIEEGRQVGIKIVKGFALLIPIITILSQIAVIIILWFGGQQVIAGTLTIGNFSAFFAYVGMFTWPLFVIGFVGSGLARGFVSLGRINEVLDAPIEEEKGEYDAKNIKGDIEFNNVSLSYKDDSGVERQVLKNISFKINANTRNAVVGPTAAGKTQIFYLMAGLVKPSAGDILIDGKHIDEYTSESLLSKIGLVFQDSIVFNTTLRENIGFSSETPDEDIKKAIQTAELEGLVAQLKHGVDSLISERGTSLSGGQKQRLMLARALAVDPKILLLDDFTARVDIATEASILKSVKNNYPEVTLISITQKVEPIKDYDNIIVIMEGELIASGTHNELLDNSFEYKQIFESQKSTENLEKNKKHE